MRIFLSVLVLIFSLQSWTKADDIREFEINGISVGDSALDYFDKEKLKNNTHAPWNDKKTYYQFDHIENSKQYEAMSITYLINDNKFIIAEVTGRNFISYERCKNQIIKISKDIENIFEEAKKDDQGEYKHSADKSKKSKVRTINYHLNDESIIHIACYNWSDEITEKNGWKDSLIIALANKEFKDWQINKAYK